MAVTPYMNLDLPTTLVTLGPDYADQNNDAFTTVDAHDHTSGKGKQVPSAGLDINANLNFQSKKPYNLYSTQYIAQGSTLTGAGNALSVFTYSGDLYYTNGSGSAIQLTDGGSIVSSPSTVQALEITSITGDLTIGASDTFVVILVDTTASRQIDLPLASTVAAGRIYIIKDVTGDANANPMTLARQGSDTIDGETTQVMTSDFGAWFVVGDGVSEWSII